MVNFSSGELLFYGGLVIMIVSAMLGGIFSIHFILKRQKLKKVLEQEYGKL